MMEIDPELVVPDPSLSIGEGAIAPWANSSSNYYEQIIAGARRRVRDRPRGAVGGARRRRARPVPLRDRRRPRRGLLPQPLRPPALVRDALRGHRPEPRAPLPRDGLRVRRARRSRSSCRSCRARRARARGCGPSRARCWSAGMAIHEFCAFSVHARADVDRRGRADRDRAPHRAADPARDRRAAALPRQRRDRLPVDGPRGGDAVGRRGAAHPAGDADRLGAGRRAVRARRAVDRPAPARQLQADRARWSACATSATPCSSSSTTSRRCARPTTSIDIGPGAGEHGGQRRRARARPRRSARSPSR